MLDECKEVKDYLMDPSASNPRIQKKILTDNYSPACKLNGLGDILSLIAAHFMYNMLNVEDCTTDISEKTIFILRMWCGFSDDITQKEAEEYKQDEDIAKWLEAYPAADGWLRAYYETHIGVEKKAPSWDFYSKKRSKQMKNPLPYMAEAVCYDSVLAQAVARGSLRKMYFLCRNEIDDIKSEKGRKLDKRTARKLKKLLAAYLLLKKNHPGQEWVLLQKQRILNWMGYDDSSTKRMIPEIIWNDAAVFESETDDAYNDFIKLRVNKDFLQVMNAQIIDVRPTKNIDGHRVYQDTGYGQDAVLEEVVI